MLLEKREGWELDGRAEQGEKTGGASGHQSLKDQQVMGGAWVLSQLTMGEVSAQKTTIFNCGKKKETIYLIKGKIYSTKLSFR